jgi:hypothetical protein
MAIIEIKIRDRIASALGGTALVSNNPTDIVRFDFDAEWGEYPLKTAKFVWGEKFVNVQIPIGTNEVQVPDIGCTNRVLVGVYAIRGEDKITSTQAIIACRHSIQCFGETPMPPTTSEYEQLMAILADGVPVHFDDLTPEQREELLAPFYADMHAMEAEVTAAFTADMEAAKAAMIAGFNADIEASKTALVAGFKADVEASETEKLNMARQLNEARRQLTPEEKRREIERPYSCESNRDAT